MANNKDTNTLFIIENTNNKLAWEKAYDRKINYLMKTDIEDCWDQTLFDMKQQHKTYQQEFLMGLKKLLVVHFGLHIIESDKRDKIIEQRDKIIKNKSEIPHIDFLTTRIPFHFFNSIKFYTHHPGKFEYKPTNLGLFFDLFNHPKHKYKKIVDVITIIDLYHYTWYACNVSIQYDDNTYYLLKHKEGSGVYLTLGTKDSELHKVYVIYDVNPDLDDPEYTIEEIKSYNLCNEIEHEGKKYQIHIKH